MRITDLLFVGFTFGASIYFIVLFCYALMTSGMKALGLEEILAAGAAFYWLVAMLGRKTRQSYLDLLHQCRSLRFSFWMVVIATAVLGIIIKCYSGALGNLTARLHG